MSIDIEAPESVALNTGTPRPFPRVNGYLLIAVDEAFLVGQTEWLTVERSAFPKRRGMQDFGLIDLPYPMRRLRLNPLGTLRIGSASSPYVFQRGADALPSIGAAVVLPTERQLRSIVESGQHRRIKIGESPLAGDADVCVDPDRIFGRHLAVLGNTGSGKSCTVAGLIRWSLEEAQELCSVGQPNARFIVLDPNGEYARAFAGDGSVKARIFKVGADEKQRALKVPLWFWNSAEWSSFTQASARTQRPLLRRALREIKAGRRVSSEPSSQEKEQALRRYLSSRLVSIRRDVRSGAFQLEESKFGFRLRAMAEDLRERHIAFPFHGLDSIAESMEVACRETFNSFDEPGTGKRVEYYRAFNERQVSAIVDALESSVDLLGGIVYQEGPDEDVPVPFNGAELADHLEMLAEQENVTQYLDFLVSRIRTFLADPKLNSVVGDAGGVRLEDWLSDYLGTGDSEGGCISVVDLSLVPTEVVHVVTAVIARMLFEALQRYVAKHGVALPTVMVMEEAHTFVKRYRDDIENQDAATVCCQTFERIAREGRKFGLGLVLSSQRPSDLSPTVLSQCNTLMLHRITNDRDQELVHRLVPDNLRGLLRELPSLPSQNAILLGWASELPVLVRMNDLPKSQQPRSDDPEFWGVWIGIDDRGNPVRRTLEWQALAQDWQEGVSE
ncbi:MAG: ATP-binding protein [Rhodospirillaceae bacterium]|nr:ATP-binding protein [Rhodospirillaceae bacterium]